MAHTPGPYRVEGGDGYLCIYSAEGTIADIELTRTGCGDNARLLAAAPDLLEALRAYVEEDEMAHACDLLKDDRESPRLIAARAAIAQAEPRP